VSLSQGGARPSLAPGYFHIVPPGLRFGSLRSRIWQNDPAPAGRAEGARQTAKRNQALPEADGSARDRYPGKLKACKTVAGGRSEATPPGLRSNNLPPTPEGSQNSGIPPGCTDPPDCQPGGLRSAATRTTL
jgi:hypothetical protein